ncbi:DegT/DnrJ/EryC1/StrS family aminotransferase [Salipaludibacillus agaradhaerens]|uniref:DegT/DnrJ/EryC1/StrS family aminotransferase n=1 Tax=Salipaludibacillus agaradhaerens TaxID=76935 RepID=UPI002151EC21|nr:DegT/DnrJ/EryC1/StrS family aminotransferase [Salipaludibacillus agaradhaerens]MCR6107298.1 DegT/DnrJ/EryC1/StrS family aminotransferase [Salipaludibacillus agaradhaerens]MCR6111348.1 DegT/DnrJ/EryC1/StrS family aminotransferase [Bacillus sp. A301a_S52]MCR6119327.1 DegT/DnrJ/EryC1/StrS family aminotransferase [Salipaludibacillus agaradhaerens]
MVSLIDLKRQFSTIKPDILAEFEKVIESGQYILGPYVNELEDEVAERLQVEEAVAVANGTDALVLTLEAYGIGSGDEVVTTPFTFFATAEAITRVGATPVFADVDEKTYNLNPECLESKITSATKAIIPVHLFGQPANMDKINEIAQKYSLYVIEDACQAFGATYKQRQAGHLGDVACFSFFPTKNLGTLGDGGMIVTSDKRLANQLRTLRVHGSSKKYFHDRIGYNSRLDELHAAILLVCLQKIDEWNANRISLAKTYTASLRHVKGITVPFVSEECKHVFHLYCLASPKRDDVTAFLNKDQIATGIYYPRCLHLQEVYQHLGYKKGDFPVAETLSEELFAIPMHPYLTINEQNQVIKSIKKAVNKL